MNNIFAIKDSANVLVQKKLDGKPFLYADYATQSANEWSTESVYAMSKSTRAVRFDANKQSTLKMSLEIFDLKWLSMLTGSDFIKGITPIKKRQVLNVDSTNKVTLASTPKVGSLAIFTLESDNITHLKEQIVGTPGTTVDTYSISGLEVTFNTTTCPEGTSVVAYYLIDSEATAQTMTIESNKFPYQVDIFADTMIRDTDGTDRYVQIHYLNAKAKGNFTITMSASDITKLEVEFDLFKDSKSDAMATYTIL